MAMMIEHSLNLPGFLNRTTPLSEPTVRALNAGALPADPLVAGARSRVGSNLVKAISGGPVALTLRAGTRQASPVAPKVASVLDDGCCRDTGTKLGKVARTAAPTAVKVKPGPVGTLKRPVPAMTLQAAASTAPVSSKGTIGGGAMTLLGCIKAALGGIGAGR